MLLLGQLVYTSFPKVGYKALNSQEVSPEIQQAFVQQIVYQYWDCYNPPTSGYRAAYIHQVSLEQTLFGWLYNDGLDDLGRSHLPYFICYYLTAQIDADQLENIFTCLQRGPVALIDRQVFPNTLEPIIVSNWSSYQPARMGVDVPLYIRDRSHIALQQQMLLDLFVPVDEHTELDASVAIAPLRNSPQVHKIALLIGVSEYGTGVEAWPAAEQNVQALQQSFTTDSEFTQVLTLLNPDPQQMSEAIETVFAERQSKDVVLLYYCGAGFRDDSGKLYLATSITRRNEQHKLVKSSAVLVSFVQEMLKDSQAQQQLVILETNFSPTEAGVADNASIDLATQLGGNGRLILSATTTSSSNYPQEHSGELSEYTRYLVEGLATGAADLDNDGMIAVNEWHEYATRRVQIATPAQQPGSYGQIGQLLLATVADPREHKYRQEVERCTTAGEISLVGRSVLDVLGQTLGITPAVAAQIEAQVLAPYREYQQKLQRYVQECVAALHHSYALSPEARAHFQQLQHRLGLRDQDIAPIEAEIALQFHALQSLEQINDFRSSQVNAQQSIPVTVVGVATDQNSKLLIGIGIAAGISAGVAVLHAYMQMNEIKNLQTEAKYEQCITKTEQRSWVTELLLAQDAEKVMNECRLEQARTLAVSEKFSAAIKIAEQIPENSLLFPEAQKLIKEWSEI